MRIKLGLSILASSLLLGSGLAGAQQAASPPASIPPEVIQSIFQLGATTHQQVAARIGEMQGKIDSLGKELAEAKKNCPAEPAK